MIDPPPGYEVHRDGDCLLLAGKGHETGQIVGTEVLPFDDAEEARGVITGLGGEVTS